MVNKQTKHIARTARQLGEALARHRRALNLTQQDVAQKAGLRQATISQLEGGNARLDTLVNVLAALHLELVVRERQAGTEIDLEEIFQPERETDGS